MRKSIQIGKYTIGADHPPYIIAELSANHNGSLERALQIIEGIAASGAQAIKLQTYRPQDITLDIKEGEFYISDPDNPWVGRSFYELYAEGSTPWEWHEKLFEKARSLGLEIFSSPFSEEAVDFLETLDCPCYKIASFENNHIPLIQKAASTGKPMIISCGMAAENDIELAVQTARDSGCKELMLLKCTSAYPAPAESINLATIADMAKQFDVPVGFSDHTLGMNIPAAAIASGAVAIEKHVTLEAGDAGPDGHFSIGVKELKELVSHTHEAWQAKGKVHYGDDDVENMFTPYRRSIYVSADMKAGDVISKDNVKVIRPNKGMHPKHYAEVMGKKVKRALGAGTPLSAEDIE